MAERGRDGGKGGDAQGQKRCRPCCCNSVLLRLLQVLLQVLLWLQVLLHCVEEHELHGGIVKIRESIESLTLPHDMVLKGSCCARLSQRGGQSDYGGSLARVIDVDFKVRGILQDIARRLE